MQLCKRDQCPVVSVRVGGLGFKRKFKRAAQLRQVCADGKDIGIRVVLIVELVGKVDQDSCQRQRIDARIELVQVCPEAMYIDLIRLHQPVIRLESRAQALFRVFYPTPGIAPHLLVDASQISGGFAIARVICQDGFDFHDGFVHFFQPIQVKGLLPAEG